MRLQPLPRDAGPLLDPLTAPLVKQFPSTVAFLAWQADLEAAIAAGRIAGLATEAHEAVLLYQEQDGLATILAGLGETSDAFLEACLDALQARCDALIWDEWVGPSWPERLAHRGVHGYELVTKVQEVARVERQPAPPELEVRPWHADAPALVVPLLTAANPGTLAGLFLSYPAAPSAEAYEQALSALLAGEKGEFMPRASFLAYLGGELAGVLLAVRYPPDGALLFELSTHPRARGRHVGRTLVGAMQDALRAQGIPRLTFITTADNVPIHRLYQEHEIVERSSSRGGYWLRGT